MSVDFSAFLLNYTQRIFLKRSDIVNLLISFIAIFIAFFAIIIAEPITFESKISLIVLTALLLGIPSGILRLILKKIMK